jgi:hypothetical protein
MSCGTVSYTPTDFRSRRGTVGVCWGDKRQVQLVHL